jgi:uncharacterized protein YutE (UPF0331/DUF86 family)
MIRERIALIKNYFGELDAVDKEKDGKARFYARSMLLFSIINASISLAEDMISRKNLQMPGNYYEIFDILAKNRAIPPALCEDMKLLVKLRNIIAHEYDSFDEKQVRKLEAKIERVKEFVKIAAAIAR